MQYLVLPSFIFGFLLTVFPRWMGLPALPRWQYAGIGGGLFGAQIALLAASMGWQPMRSSGTALVEQLVEHFTGLVRNHGLRVGMQVFHNKFGEGAVLALEGSGDDARAQVKFGRHGVKWLALSVAKLTPV